MFDNDLLQKCFHEPDLDKVEKLINYLNHISGKELTKSIIRQYLLKIKWEKKEVRLLYRCHCKAASTYLRYLIRDSDAFNKDQVKTTIADIAPYISFLDSGKTSDLLLRSTNSIPSSIHYNHAKSLFYRHDLPQDSKNNYESDLLVLYAVRLALEKRIRGFLGIDYATIKDKPIGLSKLINICKNLKETEYASTISWQEISWLNVWLNHYMHRHIRPFPWTIHQTFEILDSLLNPTMYKHGDREIHSFYASTVVFDEEQFSKEVLSKLKDLNTDIEVKWAWEKEALILN
ncbi:hypothetical protein [Pontibacter amylolyticus]|uniref:Uncharacterized protein n=1 Tax=Pontibacter amylolyticus TaxID=1424080 RepID=A0ABQ1WHL6_9BACT|nr:hypothetical protein [Pontibacter amylolyticus]GGG30701.1 hypothetical protein GCM10011323_37720 [Pontibacter amylolyticus]